MLVLSRKENESILVGNDVEIVVVRSSNGKVRLGINAPRTFLYFARNFLTGTSQRSKRHEGTQTRNLQRRGVR